MQLSRGTLWLEVGTWNIVLSLSQMLKEATPLQLRSQGRLEPQKKQFTTHSLLKNLGKWYSLLITLPPGRKRLLLIAMSSANVAPVEMAINSMFGFMFKSSKIDHTLSKAIRSFFSHKHENHLPCIQSCIKFQIACWSFLFNFLLLMFLLSNILEDSYLCF